MSKAAKKAAPAAPVTSGEAPVVNNTPPETPPAAEAEPKKGLTPVEQANLRVFGRKEG